MVKQPMDEGWKNANSRGMDLNFSRLVPESLEGKNRTSHVQEMLSQAGQTFTSWTVTGIPNLRQVDMR